MTLSKDLEFQTLVGKLSQTSHGVLHFSEIKDLLKSFADTSTRIEFLSKYLLQSQITWKHVRAKVWSTEETQNENKFHFLQGDVIETTLARGIGTSLSSNDHSFWLVVSPDCDCVRASYVKLAPVFTVDRADSHSYSKHKSKLSLAFSFKSNRLFPVGGDLFGKGTDGHFVDSTEPYFLASDDKDSAVVHFSMRVEGWHLLNGFLKESETRANLVEGAKLRTQ